MFSLKFRPTLDANGIATGASIERMRKTICEVRVEVNKLARVCAICMAIGILGEWIGLSEPIFTASLFIVGMVGFVFSRGYATVSLAQYRRQFDYISSAQRQIAEEIFVRMPEMAPYREALKTAGRELIQAEFDELLRYAGTER